MRKVRILLLMAGLAVPAAAQQRADGGFRFTIAKPAFSRGDGPRVCMDVAHYNFQSTERNPGAYRPFMDLLSGDGYRVQETSQPFTSKMLTDCDIVVIADATARENVRDWAFPHPSAFTRDELAAMYQWIRGGGGLLLIADHAPTLGAAADLGSMLGVVMVDGYARLRQAPLPDVFSREGGHLPAHAILKGRDPTESIEAVASFVGHAFQASREWSPLLVFGQGASAWVDLSFNFADLPREQWPRFSVAGWLHAGTRRVGAGRVVLLGEVSICTALVGAERRPVGMNHPGATRNAQFCLNTVRWLSGLLGD